MQQQQLNGASGPAARCAGKCAALRIVFKYCALLSATLQETRRLTKMSEDKGVAAAKKETFQWRLNVLASFSGKAADKSEL